MALINCDAKNGERGRRKSSQQKQLVAKDNNSSVSNKPVVTESGNNEASYVPQVQQRSSEKGKKFTCNECGIQVKSRELIRQHVFSCNAVRVKMMQDQEGHVEHEAPCFDGTRADIPKSGG